MSQAGDQGKGKDAVSFPPKSPARLAWLADFFFCAFHPVFCFLSHQGAWSNARGRIKQKGDRSNLCSSKKKKKSWKNSGSISQWFKSCTSQNYFRLSFVASVLAEIFFAFKVILISTCSLHLWVICNVASSKSFGRKQIYCYWHKTSK